MNCPACGNVNLMMSDRQGIEIDYCPTCRGVWLDRGELDKIIERSATAAPASESRGYSEPPRERYDERPREQHQGEYYHKKKKKGFMSELFDFD